MNPIMECRLEESKQIVEGRPTHLRIRLSFFISYLDFTEMIVNKRKLVLSELESAEEQNKRYWERRLDVSVTEQDVGKNTVDPLDADMEDELRALMRNDSFNEDPNTSVIEHKEIKSDVMSPAAAELGSEDQDQNGTTNQEEEMEMDANLTIIVKNEDSPSDEKSPNSQIE
jgi:hypothetical protein